MERGAPEWSDPRAVAAANGLPDAAELRERMSRAGRFTVGVEEEVMALDPETLELAPLAPRLLERLGSGGPYKLELPAAQLEIAGPVLAGADELAAPLLAARHRAADAAAGIAVLAAAGVHPFSAPEGVLNELPAYAHTRAEYGAIARRQLVCALHVHVAVGNAETALAVYNAARAHLPLLAALAAHGAIYTGRDSGLASVRPKLCELLPRQGVPPALESWEELAAAYRWGASTGMFIAPRTWWWELRPHPRYGTLEFRVPDAQRTVADAVAIAATVQALVVWLAERHEAGERLPVAPTWQIEENRWSACRHGLAGRLADLPGGRARPAEDVVGELLAALEPVARRVGADEGLARARALAAAGGPASAQREVFAAGGAVGVARWLAECFLASQSG